MIFLFVLFACSPPSPIQVKTQNQPNDAAIETSQPSEDYTPWCIDPAESISFTEVSTEWGLIDTTDDDPRRNEANPLAFADFNGDGLDDLIIAQKHVGIWVQINQNGSFDRFLLHEAPQIAGMAIADINSDGFLDLWAGGYMDYMLLFLGDGNGNFTDISESSGISAIETSPQKTDAAFGDFDGDGDQDLFINRATHSEDAQEDTLDKLLLNDGNGNFSDVSHWLEDSMRRGLGWSSIWTDIDLDGDLDLFTANAEQGFFGPSRLLRNDGPANDGSWSFHDLSTSCFCTDNYNPMGVSSGDWNNDGLLDLFLTNTGENQLLQNAGDGSFIDVTRSVQSMGLPTFGHMTFGASWLDIDNNGWLDIVVSSGPLHQGVGPEELEEQADQVLWWSGERFFDRAGELGLDATGAGRGVATGMLNDDGFLDIVITNLGSPSHLYLATCTSSRALVIDLQGKGANTFAMGARIVVTTPTLQLTREVGSKSGWGGSMHPRVHFGLGTQPVESLTIYWPNGDIQEPQIDPWVDGRLHFTQP